MKIQIISIFLLLNSISLFAQTDEKKKSKIIDGIKLRATQITSMARFWTGYVYWKSSHPLTVK